MAVTSSILENLSQEIIQAVQRGGLSVVNIDDGTRLTASGSIWTGDGVIVATSHGVEQDEDLVVTTSEGKEFKATVVGRDPESDIAVLRIDASGLPSFKGSALQDVGVGALVLALGRPGGVELQSTFGVIRSTSGVRLPKGDDNLYYPDATLYPGFSGGALVDARGNFIGLLNLAFGRGRGVALGAAIVREVVDAILAHGSVQRGYLGIASQPAALSKTLREAIGRDEEKGLLVISVEADSPAETAGLLVGDTILTLSGQATGDPYELRRALRSMRSGDEANLEVVRAGQLQAVAVTLGASANENGEDDSGGQEYRHRHRRRWRRH